MTKAQQDHRNLVAEFVEEGYVVIEIYPVARITILQDNTGMLTVKGTKTKIGYYPPKINKNKRGTKMNEEIKTTTEEESQDNSVTREDTETLIVSNNGITSTKDIGKLVSALAKAQINFDNISKDAKNPFFKSLYSSLDEIIRATRRHLAKRRACSFSIRYRRSKSCVNSIKTIT